MRTIKILIILTALLATSCHWLFAPKEFLLNQESEYLILGENLSTIESLDVTGLNHLTLRPGARIALRTLLVSQLLADFSVNIQEGEGLKFYFRTVVNDFDTHPRMEFDYTTHGCTVKENDKVLRTFNSLIIENKSDKRIKIKNDGALVTITVDCDTIYYGSTALNSTEYIIIEALPNTTARLYGIYFAEAELIKKTYDVLLKTKKKDY